MLGATIVWPRRVSPNGKAIYVRFTIEGTGGSSTGSTSNGRDAATAPGSVAQPPALPYATGSFSYESLTSSPASRPTGRRPRDGRRLERADGRCRLPGGQHRPDTARASDRVALTWSSSWAAQTPPRSHLGAATSSPRPRPNSSRSRCVGRAADRRPTSSAASATWGSCSCSTTRPRSRSRARRTSARHPMLVSRGALRNSTAVIHVGAGVSTDQKTTGFVAGRSASYVRAGYETATCWATAGT